jgi:hypothetical protein
LLLAREFSVATNKVSDSLRTTPIDMVRWDIILWRYSLLQLADLLVEIILEDKMLNIAIFSTFKEENWLKALPELLNTKYFLGIAFQGPRHAHFVTDCNAFVPKGPKEENFDTIWGKSETKLIFFLHDHQI